MSEYCERILFIEIAKDILDPPLQKANAAATYSTLVYCENTILFYLINKSLNDITFVILCTLFDRNFNKVPIWHVSNIHLPSFYNLSRCPNHMQEGVNIIPSTYSHTIQKMISALVDTQN